MKKLKLIASSKHNRAIAILKANPYKLMSARLVEDIMQTWYPSLDRRFREDKQNGFIVGRKSEDTGFMEYAAKQPRGKKFASLLTHRIKHNG